MDDDEGSESESEEAKQRCAVGTTQCAEASKDEYISQFSAVLENDCDELTKTAVDIRLHAQNEMILDDKSDTQQVWDYTKDLVNKVADLKAQAKTIQKHQRHRERPKKQKRSSHLHQWKGQRRGCQIEQMGIARCVFLESVYQVHPFEQLKI